MNADLLVMPERSYIFRKCLFSSFFFSERKDSKLVSLGLSKKFGEARVTNKQLTQNYVFFKT